jgi:hypothetical protein
MTLTSVKEPANSQNFPFDKKTNQMVQKKTPKFEMTEVRDHDGDGLEDNVVTIERKVYSFKYFFSKNTDYQFS